MTPAIQFTHVNVVSLCRTGELRAVSMAQKRVAEGERLGFKQCVMPSGNIKGLKKPENMAIYAAANISQLLELILD